MNELFLWGDLPLFRFGGDSINEPTGGFVRGVPANPKARDF